MTRAASTERYGKEIVCVCVYDAAKTYLQIKHISQTPLHISVHIPSFYMQVMQSKGDLCYSLDQAYCHVLQLP